MNAMVVNGKILRDNFWELLREKRSVSVSSALTIMGSLSVWPRRPEIFSLRLG